MNQRTDRRPCSPCRCCSGCGCGGARCRCRTSSTRPGRPSTCSARTTNEAEIIQVDGPQDLPRRRRAADDHGLRHGSRRPRQTLLRADERLGRPATTPSTRTTRLPRRTRPPRRTESEGAVQMVTSQDAAIAVALTRARLRGHPTCRWSPTSTPDAPADGKLEVGDLFLEVDGKPVDDRRGRRRRRSSSARRGEPRRARRPARRQAAHVEVTPWSPEAATDGLGSASRSASGYDFPFDVTINIDAGHRRAERRADVLARDLRHAHARARSPAARSSPAPARIDARRHGRPDRRHPAEDRRRRATPAPSCSWCRRTTATRRCERRQRRHAAGAGRRPCTSAGWRIEAWADDPDADLPSCEDDGGRRDATRRRDLDVDPALAAAVLEIETPRRRRRLGPAGPALRAGRHRRSWCAREPALAAAMGLDDASAARLADRRSSRTSCRPTSRSRRCSSRSSGPTRSPAAPPSSSGWCCRRRADDADPGRPGGGRRSSRASTPTGRRCGSWRARPAHGATYCALRLRAHDDDQSVVGGADLVPGLLALLRATLERRVRHEPRAGDDRERAVRRASRARRDAAPARAGRAVARADHHRRRAGRRRSSR